MSGGGSFLEACFVQFGISLCVTGLAAATGMQTALNRSSKADLFKNPVNRFIYATSRL